MRFHIAFLVFASLATGCSDSTNGTTPDATPSGSTCATIAAKICQAACDCDPAQACITSYANGAVTARYDHLQHCTTFETFACGMSGTTEAQQQTCLGSLGGLSCMQVTHDGSTYGAAPVPAECKDVI